MHPSEPSHPYQVAHELLESALRLYFEHKAYSAALHLAGAVEELLGKLLREKDGTPHLDDLQRIMMEAWNKLASESVETWAKGPLVNSICPFVPSSRSIRKPTSAYLQLAIYMCRW